MGVARGVFEFEFLDEARLTGAGARAVAISTDDVHLHLAGGVTAEDGAVLHEDDARAVAGSGERGADAGEAAADDDEVGGENMVSHTDEWVGAGLRVEP